MKTTYQDLVLEVLRTTKAKTAKAIAVELNMEPANVASVLTNLYDAGRVDRTKVDNYYVYDAVAPRDVVPRSRSKRKKADAQKPTTQLRQNYKTPDHKVEPPSPAIAASDIYALLNATLPDGEREPPPQYKPYVPPPCALSIGLRIGDNVQYLTVGQAKEAWAQLNSVFGVAHV